MKNLLSKPKINKTKIVLTIILAVIVLVSGYIVRNYGEGLLYTFTNYDMVLSQKKSYEALIEANRAFIININAQTMTEANLSK